MFKKLALTALVVASVSAFAQNSQTTGTTTNMMNDNGGRWSNANGSWSGYNTYTIGSTELNGLDQSKLWRIVDHDLKQGNAADAYLINTFIDRLPSDQAYSLAKAIANNYKQASMVRDEVALARFGSDTQYAWLSYPLLTWSDTPGQNSWSALNLSSTSPSQTMMDNNDTMVAMTDDQSRPMRMVMSNRGGKRDIDYDRAVFILTSGLSDIEKGNIHEIFHPTQNDPNTYSHETELDAVIRTIELNASMVDHLDRYAWYNHFDKEYYGRHHSDN